METDQLTVVSSLTINVEDVSCNHPGYSVPVSRDDRLMKKATVKVLKLIYLLVLCVGITSAITYGMYLALQVFFTVLSDTNIFKITFFFLFPVFHYAYIFCFLVAYPMLATMHKLEECCMEGSGKKATKWIIIMILENVLGLIVTASIIYVVDPMFLIYGPVHNLWIWELPTIILFIIFAMNLPRIAGTLNASMEQFHLFGYHVHESMFGIIYFFAAILLVFNARVSVIDLIFASFFFVFGGFLFGRDFKDVMAGKFIEKLPPSE